MLNLSESMPYTKKTGFISIEISIKSHSEVPNFIKWFESQDNYVCNVKDKTGRRLVYCDPIHGSSVDTVVRELCAKVNEFPNDVRLEWDQADERFFHIGFEGGDNPQCYTQDISMDSLKKLVSIGAYLKFSIYPAELTDEDGIPQSFSQEN